MPALVTRDESKARLALTQLEDPGRFDAPYGPTNVARNHLTYDPHSYWRGPAWPPLNYLFWIALRRWNLRESAAKMRKLPIDGALQSRWAEYWNPTAALGSALRRRYGPA